MTPDKKPGLKVMLALFAKEKYPNFINGGEFETFAITQGKKGSNGSRRCRELADEGTLERRMNGKSVEYRYKPSMHAPATFQNVERFANAIAPTNRRCAHCSKDAVTYKDSKPVCQAHSVREVAPARLF